MKRFMITALAATLPSGVEYNERGYGWSSHRSIQMPQPEAARD